MELQQTYEAIRAYFTQPDADFAITTDGKCKYRTEDGRGCAVGCLIPPALYKPAMEGRGVQALVVKGMSDAYQPALEEMLLDDAGVDRARALRFLEAAQGAHDN